MEIYGTDGVLWLRTERGPLALWRKGADAWAAHPLPSAPLGHRHHQGWVNSLLNGAGPRAPTTDGLRSVLVAEAIAASAERGGARTPVEAA